MSALSFPDEIRRHPPPLPRLFRRARAPRGAQFVARPRRRSDPAVHQRRHGAVQAHLPGPGAARLRAGDDLPEVRARRRQAQRPRAGGPHRAAPHLLRDAGQLLLRRLLQARRDRVRLGVRHRARSSSGIAPERLRVTVHHTDDEARALWREIAGLPDDRIYGLGDKDNFWQMGDTGPCGPCSEIYVDLEWKPGRGRTRGSSQAEFEELAEAGRFLEIWNLVFMQYDRSADGTLTPLPKPSVDTGAGLERIAAVHAGRGLQLPHRPLPAAARAGGASWSGAPYDRGPAGASYRVLADHARAVSFLLADGVFPRTRAGATCCAASCAARCATPGCWAAASRRSRRSPQVVVARAGRRVSRAACQGATTSTSTTEAEEQRFLETIEGGLRRLDELLAAGATVISGRGGVQAVRHLRLPARPDRAHRRGARGVGGPRGLRGGAGGAAEAVARRATRPATRRAGPGGACRRIGRVA